MVKAVVGDEDQLSVFEDRLTRSGLTCEVGLVIGKLSSRLGRGFVFQLVPTPQNDAGEPPCSLIDASSKDDKKKGSKSKSQSVDSSPLIIDNDWVAEHARQVSRMLVGGVKVVGVYVWVSDSAFKNSTITLCQTVKGIVEAAPISYNNWDERLLVHISCSPRRWMCRTVVLSSNITSSSLKLCDFKMGRVLSSLQTYKCTYKFELRLPIFREGGSSARTMNDSLRYGIDVHAKELKAAKAIIDGKLVAYEESSTTDGLHEVELLTPFMKNSLVEVCSQRDVAGILAFSGSICSFVYSNSKEPVLQAIADIKDDIIKSLQSRLDIICDEADEDQNQSAIGIEASEDTERDKPSSKLTLHLSRRVSHLSFPRRVFIPWLGSTFICDYLQPSEKLEVLKDRCAEMMSMDFPTDASTILQPETEALSPIVNSFWDVVVPGQFMFSSHLQEREKVNTVIAESNRKPLEGSNVNAVVSVIILLVSILVGVLLFRQA